MTSVTEEMIEAASREIAMGSDDQAENWVEYSSIARAALEAALSASPSAQTDGRVLTVFDWAWTDETGQQLYARTPERAERLRAEGYKLTPVYAVDLAPAAQTEVVATLLTSTCGPPEKLLEHGWVPNVIGYKSTPLYTAPSAPQPTEPVVKPLQWREFEYDNSPTAYEAKWLGGFYSVRHWGGAWRWRTGAFDGAKLYGGGLGDFASAAEAKAAAQADYNARILSALASPVAQQRDEVIEECAKVADAESNRREHQANLARAGDASWGADLTASAMAQIHKAVTARNLACQIRSLKSKQPEVK